MKQFMRQHSYMNGRSFVCPFPLLAKCMTHPINAAFKMNELLGLERDSMTSFFAAPVLGKKTTSGKKKRVATE